MVALYHGARRWSGAAEVRAGRAGHVEHGPGIYLTTRYETAAKYAKGGGRVLKIHLSPRLRWLEDAVLPVSDATDFIFHLRTGKRKEIFRDLLAAAVRTATRFGAEHVAAGTLVNLIVNAGAASGQNGIALAQFLAQHGVDASHVTQSGEDWVVVFNPRVITRVEEVSPRGEIEWDLPRVRR